MIRQTNRSSSGCNVLLQDAVLLTARAPKVTHCSRVGNQKSIPVPQSERCKIKVSVPRLSIPECTSFFNVFVFESLIQEMCLKTLILNETHLESLNHFIHTFREILFSCLIYFLNLSLSSVVKLYFAHKQCVPQLSVIS